MSSIRKTNKTIVIEDGKISQIGNHNELIKIEGYYKALYDKQVREKI